MIVVSLLISGSSYLRAHERLDYANLDEGELKRSSLPQLKGMAIRGDWLPNFEELVRYTDAHIPRDEGILVLPGEDLFYFTTGRTPKFPVLMFDHTVNPYSPKEIVNLARDRNIRWLIVSVKQDLQDEDEGVEKQRDELTEELEQDFEQIESLSGYDIYQRAGRRLKRGNRLSSLPAIPPVASPARRPSVTTQRMMGGPGCPERRSRCPRVPEPVVVGSLTGLRARVTPGWRTHPAVSAGSATQRRTPAPAEQISRRAGATARRSGVQGGCVNGNSKLPTPGNRKVPTLGFMWWPRRVGRDRP